MQPPPRAPYPSYPPVGAPSPPGMNLLPLVFVVVFLVIFGGIAFAMAAAFGFGGSGFTAALLGPACMVGFLLLIVVVAFVANAQRRAHIPPPPPIQQPMVPAGTQAPVALNCPNCGAPPESVDRFGIAVCPYCETRFMVR